MSKVSAKDVVGHVAKVSGSLVSGSQGKIVLIMPTGPVTLVAKSNSASTLIGGAKVRVIGNEAEIAIVEEVTVKAPHVPVVPEWDALEESLRETESAMKE
jgi:hypothetical protein